MSRFHRPISDIPVPKINILFTVAGMGFSQTGVNSSADFDGL